MCRVRFDVIDSGIGISEDTLARLFQPFVQADSSVTRMYGGTGLGLSICKRLLALMGSHIDVESSPEAGSTFCFELALGAAAPAPVAPVAPLLPPETVLVLTPLRHHADVLVSYLNAWQMRARHVTSPEEALQLAGAMQPVLAIVDGSLPDAAETARMLAESQPGLRLLLIAGVDSFQEPALRRQFHATLRRPFRQAALQEALLFALERRHYMVDATAQGSAGDKPSEAPESAVPGLVLLVEDNLINQKVALHQLGRLGYTAHVASNGEEALTAIALHDYALVLMDCQMPVLDGFEATRRIRDAERHDGRRLPIVAMTANAAEGDRERCLAAGMDDYLAKPIVSNALAALLHDYVPVPAQAGAASGASLRTGTGAASAGGALRCE